ncbi:DUF1302 domain-containing protein [Pseudomonas fluorescens]|uniref:DUF1302 domain-containing protein n=1 Tax=Pseudomonas fluorescens TaxID=294 RepID=A0A5E7UY22_PSEFL|nr:DUF1302 domain-containing protein [Pseudomonas fluorescens]VVQ15455.1 hypothetical protein PS928_04264 [Pseudomonas fluorescens]
MKNNKKISFLSAGVAFAIATMAASPAHSTTFEFGDGWQGDTSSNLSLASSWRMHNPDKKLVSPATGSLVGISGGSGNASIDEGNVNYAKGDAISTQVKLISEMGISKDDMGAFIRAKAWYDYALNNNDVIYGSQNNGYNNYNPATNTLGSRRPLDDDGLERLSRYQGVYLLDAYVYNTFDVAGQPLQVRLGNQVVNWGESLFIQGLNQINPIDLPSFRKPGTQVKEVFLPVPILFASQSLGEWGGLEAFYQFKWENTPVESGCGNYWSNTVGALSTDPASGCALAIGLVGNNPASFYGNAYVPTIDSDKPSNKGEFGLAYRKYMESIESELGLYAMKIHSRTPILSIQHLDNYPNISPFAAKWEYPEDIKIYGVSLSGNVLGWSVAGELSHSRDVPVQIDGNDMLLAALGANGFITGSSVAFGPEGQNALAAVAGDGYQQGYTRTNKTQLQFNTIKVGRGILSADQYLLVGEVGFQWNDLDLSDDSLRYNRGFIFGPAADERYGTSCQAQNINAEGCHNDGYVTHFAWGYRLRGELTYNNVMGTGVSVTPSVFWSHDVKGWSVDSQFAEDRMALGIGTKFSYDKKYTLDLSMTEFNRNANYDTLRDRGFYSAAFSVSF